MRANIEIVVVACQVVHIVLIVWNILHLLLNLATVPAHYRTLNTHKLFQITLKVLQLRLNGHDLQFRIQYFLLQIRNEPCTILLLFQGINLVPQIDLILMLHRVLVQ